MGSITLRVLEGSDRGRLFEELPSPVTIGREEGNSIQLNDERVSRFHVKIQEDQSELVLTDLESTNGTKVNGEETHLRILRHGDTITLGRSTLLFGSRQEIRERLVKLNGGQVQPGADRVNLDDSQLQAQLCSQSGVQLALQDIDPPQLPSGLSPGQAAQLVEVLEYVHLRIRSMINSVQFKPKDNIVELDYKQWQHLLDIQDRLAQYLRDTGLPDR
jgi:pSer/pThr/pTyr-binding forkhead associated (FHA) protein